MKRWYLSVLLALSTASLCSAQSDTPQTVAPNPAAPAQAAASNADIKGSFPVTLMKGLDSKKMKEGDIVTCQTVAALHSRSGLLIPSGSKVIAHITQATARSKGSPDSTLAMSFDKIEIAKGKELPMKGTLQAVGPSLADDSANSGGPSSNVLMGGHSSGGSSAPATTAPPQSSGNMNAPSTKPMLLATSQGVLGVRNLQLDANGVLSSTGKEVKVDSGSQLLIRAEISTLVE